MSNTRRHAASDWRWAVPALLLLLPFLAWPLGAMLWRGASPDGVPSGDAIVSVLSDRFYWERLVFTTAQAIFSTLLSVLVGLPAAYLLSQFNFPGRSVVRAAITVPFVLPTIVVALAFQQLLGPSGWVNGVVQALGGSPFTAIGTLWAILLAHVFFNLAIVVRLVGGVWANLDAQQEEAARLLGADRVRTFRYVTFPALFPAIASAAALVFTFTFTSFGVVLILGGPRFDTLEVTIYRLAARLVQLPEAAVLSAVQLAATIVALTLYTTLQRRTARGGRLRPDRARSLKSTSWAERALIVVVAPVLTVLVVAPIAALILGAVTRDGVLTGRYFASLFVDTGTTAYVPPLQAIRWSFTFALGATAIAVVVGASAGIAVARARGRASSILDALLMLPLAVPAVVLGFGFLTTFNRGVYDLRGSPVLVLIAHALVAYPFVLRAVLAVARSMDPHLPEAAAALGASPSRVWRFVELPILARAILVGAVFAFAVSLGEFGATLLLRRREFATVPIAIFEALGRPGPDNLGRALALATILMGVTVVAFLIIERFRYRDVGEF